LAEPKSAGFLFQKNCIFKRLSQNPHARMAWVTEPMNIQYPTLNTQISIEDGDIYLDVGCSLLQPDSLVTMRFAWQAQG
jgi:hypothetical protein